jgi:hypothetical protein
MGNNENINSYEVLSPWADADPIQWKGINQRLADLTDKKIGLFGNSKRTAEPTLRVVEERLKKRYPTASFSRFSNLKPNETAVEYEIKDEFEEWLKGLDAVIASYGD